MTLLADVIGYGTHAARPAAGSAGRLYYESDTDTLLRDNGTAWNAFALGGGSAFALSKIAEVVVGAGGAATIDFGSIPGTFRSLQLLMQLRGDTSATLVVVDAQFNGDTTANYDYQQMYASGAGAVAAGAQSVAGTSIKVSQCTAALGPANAADSAMVVIPNYAGTTFQKALVAHFTTRADAVSGMYDVNISGWWHSTAAISSILLSPESGNFAEGSVASLYGVS